MNKALIATIIAILIAVATAGFVIINRANKNEIVPVSSNSEEIIEQTAEKPQSLRELLGLGTSQTCTFTDAETSNSGTIYVSSGKMRGDFVTPVNGIPANSHMVLNDTYMYVWTDSETTGIKMSLEQFNTTSETENTPKSVDLDKQIDYKCVAGTSDDSLFLVPTDREFMEIGEMMKGIKPSTTMDSGVGASSQCAACDSLSGETKTQCLQALSCN